MVNERDMQKALDELKASSKPNISNIADKYGLERTTLSLRVKGKTTSRAEFLSERYQCLTNAQERVLIAQINRLTERGIPPTSQMVKNFAEEMIGRAVGKNWASQFCRRHQSELKSLYLRNIENLRVKGEYGPTYKLIYDLVECYFALLCCIRSRISTNAFASAVTIRHRKPLNICGKCLQLRREGLLDRTHEILKKNHVKGGLRVGTSTPGRTRRKP
jgi:hypothetical protein